MFILQNTQQLYCSNPFTSDEFHIRPWYQEVVLCIHHSLATNNQCLQHFGVNQHAPIIYEQCPGWQIAKCQVLIHFLYTTTRSLNSSQFALQWHDTSWETPASSVYLEFTYGPCEWLMFLSYNIITETKGLPASSHSWSSTIDGSTKPTGTNSDGAPSGTKMLPEKSLNGNFIKKIEMN